LNTEKLKKHILLIDKDKDLQEFLERRFEKGDYQVDTVSSGVEALKLLKKKTPDVILTELKLGAIRGSTLLDEIRDLYSHIPVIILTEKDSTESLVKSFKLGVDDYITKPFDFAELKARMEARMEGQSSKSESQIKYKDIVIDKDKKQIFKGDQPVKLSHMEYDLLLYLLKNKGRVMSRDILLDRVWGMSKFVDTRSVDVYVGRLRKKLGRDEEDDEKYIRTRRGFGYILTE
jgi:DNA-binding response OmpR family regulator